MEGWHKIQVGQVIDQETFSGEGNDAGQEGQQLELASIAACCQDEVVVAQVGNMLVDQLFHSVKLANGLQHHLRSVEALHFVKHLHFMLELQP
jgi:hypothetical protein